MNSASNAKAGAVTDFAKKLSGAIDAQRGFAANKGYDDRDDDLQAGIGSITMDTFLQAARSKISPVKFYPLEAVRRIAFDPITIRQDGRKSSDSRRTWGPP